MPVSKPSELPEWASNGPGVADITDPLSTKKQTGWVGGTEKPAHDYFNWWMYTVWLWCTWLNDITNQAFTWAAAQTFTAGITSTSGPNILNGAIVHNGCSRSNTGSADAPGTYSDHVSNQNVHFEQDLKVDGSLIMSGFTLGVPSLGGAYSTASNNALRYWKTSDGTVIVQGAYTKTSPGTSHANIFQLPSGYRPGSTTAVGFALQGSTITGDASVDTSGNVSANYASSAGAGVLLIMFRPDAP